MLDRLSDQCAKRWRAPLTRALSPKPWHAQVLDTEALLASEASAGQQAQAEAAALNGELASVKSALADAVDTLAAERAAGPAPAHTLEP